jgi:hypothetical protein
MGDIYKDDDYHIEIHIEGLNLRFAPGPPLEEMVRLQNEFEIFSDQHKLQDSIAVLNVTAASWDLRAKWYALLAWIAGLDSNQPGKKGGPAIVSALQQNLGYGKRALPVHFGTHDYKSEPRVLIDSRDDQQPIFYITQPYLTVSLPLRAKKQRGGRGRKGGR